jgi:hypothetical protein
MLRRVNLIHDITSQDILLAALLNVRRQSLRYRGAPDSSNELNSPSEVRHKGVDRVHIDIIALRAAKMASRFANLRSA